MIVPASIIGVLCLIAFVVAYYQYYRLDPKRRVLNLRFAIMLGAVLCAVSYPVVYKYYYHEPQFRLISETYLAVAVFLLAGAYVLLRRMQLPERKH
jgi:hypothetical protein